MPAIFPLPAMMVKAIRIPVTRGSSACVAASAPLALVIVFSALVAAGAPALAQSVASDVRPYDDKLMRLSEILGAVHYLRELCGASEGQKWRDGMKELMDTEGSSALRRARLTRSFNNGYRAYSRT